MAKGVDQINDRLNIEVDTQRLEQAISVIKQGSKAAVNNVDKLSKGYLDILGKLESTAVNVNKQVTSATSQVKSLGLQLKQISTLVAGSDALRNQAAVKGFTAGFYQDKEYVKAKMALAEAQKQAATEKATRLWRDQNIINNSNGKITQTNLNDLRQMEGLDRRLGAIQIKLMANYKAINMVTGAFKYLLNYTVEYDRELHQLQAIAAVSDTTMLKLKDSIQAVASSTKFTSLEVAQAGTVLAQAGLSARQIETTLPAIAKLATATGTDLATSTDVITSTLNIYSLQASEAEHVTNALTTAMNESKADIAGFQKAIQYAGNYAAQLGVTYEETAAVISAATQAGIRSRSMLGTGLRAVLAEFLNPTKKLTAQLEKVGLTVSDIDVRSKGLSTVLKTLKESGFGATEAFRGMERRGAAFLASIINQTEFIDNLREHMAASTAAAEANEIQMSSLSAQLANFKSIAGTAASEGVAPLNKAMTALLRIVNTLLSGGATSGGKPNALAGGIMSFLFGAGGVASTATSIAMIGGAIATMANQIKMLEAASKATNTMKLLSFLASWKGVGIISALGGIASAALYAADKLGLFTSGADKARAVMEEAQGDYEEAKEKGDALATMYQRLFDQREKLQDQTERDIFLREILTRFPEAAKYVDDLKVSFEGLVNILKQLRAENAGEQAEKAAKEARTAIEENYKIVKKLGETYFGDTEYSRQRGINGFYISSQNYNNLVSKLKATKGFEGLNYKELIGRGNVDPSVLGFHATRLGYEQASSRYLSQGLYNQLRSQINFNSTNANDLLRQYGQLYSSGLTVGGKEGEALMAVIKKLGEEVRDVAKSLTANEKKLVSDVEAIFSDQVAKEQKIYSEFTQSTRDSAKIISEQIKITGTDNETTTKLVNSLMEDYRQQRDKLESMEEVIRNPDGSKKDFKDYSIQELAKYRGMDESDIKEIFKYFKQNGITDEGHIKELIAGDQDRNFKLDSIRAYMEVLEDAIRKSNFGNIQFDRAFTDLHYTDAIKALKSIPTSKDLKQATQATGKYLTNMAYSKEANLAKALSSTLDTENYGKFRKELKNAGVFQISGDISAKNFDSSRAFDREKATSKIVGIYQDVLGKPISQTSDEYKSITSQVDAFGAAVNTANSEITSFVNKAPQITNDIITAQTGLESFFHELNIDIKKVDLAYTNATRSMDQMLARQQGVITGLERVFGSGSLLVQAAQIRLRKMEEGQLERRTEALETKRSGYEKQLARLQNNKEYRSAKSDYEAREAAWQRAIASGDQRKVNQTYNDMQKSLKAWDKLASKEESLTSKIADLNDEITKNNEILYSVNENLQKEKTNPLGSFKEGIDAAIIKNNEDLFNEGLTTFGGMGGYLTSNSIGGITSAFKDLFDNITTGSKSASESFRAFGRSVIQTIADVAKEMMAKQVVAAIFSAFLPNVSSTGGISKSGGWSTQASGGLVTGPIKNRDSVPTMLMPGEYVLKKSAVDSLGRDYLDGLNNRSSTYMTGYSSEVTEAKSEGTSSGSQKGSGVVNVYVVGQEQQKQMTPQDVVVTITQDMLTGGQTKKLVKSIATGVI